MKKHIPPDRDLEAELKDATWAHLPPWPRFRAEDQEGKLIHYNFQLNEEEQGH